MPRQRQLSYQSSCLLVCALKLSAVGAEHSPVASQTLRHEHSNAISGGAGFRDRATPSVHRTGDLRLGSLRTCSGMAAGHGFGGCFAAVVTLSAQSTSGFEKALTAIHLARDTLLGTIWCSKGMGNIARSSGRDGLGWAAT
jgi:hypothetical protein